MYFAPSSQLMRTNSTHFKAFTKILISKNMNHPIGIKRGKFMSDKWSKTVKK